jgi:NAD(P)-dependent dehydrogenase (short-subunit alcohol dehydrogenase family)
VPDDPSSNTDSVRPRPEDLQPRVKSAIELLEQLLADPDALASLDRATYRRLCEAAGPLARPTVEQRRALDKALRRQRRAAKRQAREQALEQTGIRAKRREAIFATPLTLPPTSAGAELPEASTTTTTTTVDERACYVCKAPFDQLHHFYDQLCPPCAELNWDKRNQSTDLSGRVALITGARVKIGYQAAIKLLRAGAKVVVTTRFPRDAAARYAREADFDSWRERLEIYGLDLRHTPSVERLARHLDANLERLDFIINNACQTVRRPPGFYRHLMQHERELAAALPASSQTLLAGHEALCGELQPNEASASGALMSSGSAADDVGIGASAELSQLALLDEDHRDGPQLFPAGQLDADLQQVDLRELNSWRLTLAEVPTLELLEVQLVNAVAPFVLNARLKPLMLRSASRDKHIVNVSAMEGQFYRRHKTDKHPHTNMAKAALNMMTRTSAADYAKDGIHINSVDTGWVTDEDPAEIAARKVAVHGFSPPLDIVDGAARIVDPIFDGFESGVHRFGLFLKDYMPTDW